MNFLFAWRYFKAKKSTNAINIIAWTSIVAIVFGTASLILVLSVFNGFENLVKSLYSSFYTDLKVTPAAGKTMLVSFSSLQQLKNLKGIQNFSLVAEEKALLQNGDYQTVVHLKGVDENYRYTTGVANHLVSGSYDLGNEESPGLVLGAGVENALGIVSDRELFLLKIYLPKGGASESVQLAENISSDSIRSTAAFMIQQDFDAKYGITSLAFVKRALQLQPDEYSGLEIRLAGNSSLKELKRQVRKIFADGYLVQDRYEQNSSLFSVMRMERWVIFGVLSLILAVAAFNMIGALTMLVLEKRKDISILHALGSNRSFIQKIFIAEGILLAVIGSIIGMLLAYGFIWLQQKYHLVPLSGGSFLIDYFPVQPRVTDFILVASTVFIVAVLASWIPSKKAAAQPFSLRSE